MKQQKAILCCITTDSICPVSQAEKALNGGASMIQLRNKSASGADLYSWAKRIQELCQAHDATCIINDRLDIALAVDADGVHLGQNDLPAEAARKLLGSKRILGISVATADEAKKAVASGADYLGLGHIFPTVSKHKSSEPIGLERIVEVTKTISIPVIAIGGITDDNVCDVLHAGASGIAVISAVANAPDPENATGSLSQKIHKCRQ